MDVSRSRGHSAQARVVVMNGIVCAIPTLGRPQLAARVVHDLLEQTLTPDVVIVVDASDSETFAALDVLLGSEDRSRVVHERAHTASLTAQRNQGIDLALALDFHWDYIQFMDDDVSFDADYLERAVTTMRDGGWAGLCGATDEARSTTDASIFERVFLLAPPAPGQISKSGRNAGFRFDPTVDRPIAAQWILGCSLYTRSVVERQRFWEQPGYVLYEDVEFSARVNRAGLRVGWLPSLRLGHLELSRSDVAHERAAYQAVYNRAKVLNSLGRRPGVGFWWGLLGLVARSAGGILLRRRSSRLRTKGYLRAIRDSRRDFGTVTS